MDNVFESNQDNNVTAGNWIRLLPNRIDNIDYQALCYFFNTNYGYLWNQKWDLSSNIINSTNWQGVRFEEGHVTAISLPSNQVQGGVPLVLLTLPKLRDLNLSDNQLTSRIDSTITNAMFISSFKTDSLVSINLAYNLFEGEIPSIFRKFIHLKSLNLQGNMLNSLIAPLPLNITELNLRNQTIKIDSIQLSLTPSIKIPSISKYNHLTQSFDFNPNFSLLNIDIAIGGAYYNGSNYQLFTTNQMNWSFDSGQSFVLRQENGLASDTRYLFKIFFVKGDANIDQQVDILDVQHSLNYLLGDQPQPFNVSAANTYNDTLITVQDIVQVVNIILSSQADTTATGLQKAKSSFTSVNQLYIENNNLILNAEESVSAIDITLSGISDKELGLALNSSSFQLMSRNLDGGGTRIIIFSPTGKEIKAGKTIIAELYNASAGLIRAKLSDKNAQVVGVSLSNNVFTDLKNSSDLNFSAFTMSNKALVMLPSNVDKLQASLYTTQGVLVDNKTLVDLHAGKNTIDYNSSELNSGVYILKLSANIQDKVRIINTKLIISK